MSLIDKMKTMGWSVIIFFTVKGLFTLYFGARIVEYFASITSAEETTA